MMNEDGYDLCALLGPDTRGLLFHATYCVLVTVHAVWAIDASAGIVLTPAHPTTRN